MEREGHGIERGMVGLIHFIGSQQETSGRHLGVIVDCSDG